MVPVACPVPDRAEGAPKLSGRLAIDLQPDTRAARIYGRTRIDEEYFCNFELDPAFQPQLAASGLCLSGLGERGEIRIVELLGHRFFVATAFLPQHTSAPGRPHPLVTAYLEAVLARREAAATPGASRGRK
jgi:CTP synthase (UTP-ammonia lyase)